MSYPSPIRFFFLNKKKKRITKKFELLQGRIDFVSFYLAFFIVLCTYVIKYMN